MIAFLLAKLLKLFWFETNLKIEKYKAVTFCLLIQYKLTTNDS